MSKLENLEDSITTLPIAGCGLIIALPIGDCLLLIGKKNSKQQMKRARARIEQESEK